MNAIRCFISVFLVALLGVSIAGWVWAGGQPSPKMEGSRVVLTLCGLSAVGCLWLLWSARPGEITPEGSGATDAAQAARGERV